MHPLIYDWNTVDAPPAPTAPLLLDDETLRDGQQSPSVRTPTIEQKLEILHLIDSLGIETANIGLPGAGAHVVRDVERLAREMADARLKVAANCASRTVIADIVPIAEIVQRTGVPIECCTFLGSSPIRQYTGDWTSGPPPAATQVAVSFGEERGLGARCATAAA